MSYPIRVVSDANRLMAAYRKQFNSIFSKLFINEINHLVKQTLNIEVKFRVFNAAKFKNEIEKGAKESLTRNGNRCIIIDRSFLMIISNPVQTEFTEMSKEEYSQYIACIRRDVLAIINDVLSSCYVTNQNGKVKVMYNDFTIAEN